MDMSESQQPGVLLNGKLAAVLGEITVTSARFNSPTALFVHRRTTLPVDGVKACLLRGVYCHQLMPVMTLDQSSTCAAG